MSDDYREFDLKIVEQIALVGTKVDAVHRRIDSFDNKLDKLDTRITKLEHSNTRIVAIAGTIAACVSSFFPIILSWIKEALHL